MSERNLGGSRKTDEDCIKNIVALIIYVNKSELIY